MSTLVSNELFAQPGHRDDVTNLLPALRPGRYSRTPSRTRYRPTSATPLRSSDNQAVRTNLIKVGARGDPLSSTAEQLAICISIRRDLARECAHLPH
jgi:hypothetical protein